MSWLGFLAEDGKPGGPAIQAKQPAPYQPQGGMQAQMVGMPNQMYAGSQPGAMPFPYSGAQPGSVDAAMYGIENAGALAMQNPAGIQPNTGPSLIDVPGQVQQPGVPSDAPKEEGKGFDWMSLVGGNSGPPPMSNSQSRGVINAGSPRAMIDPKTGLLRWEGGLNVV